MTGHAQSGLGVDHRATCSLSLFSFPLESHSFVPPHHPQRASATMGSSSRSNPRLPGFCLNRIAARVRVRSPPPPPPTEETKSAPANAAEEKPSEEAEAAARGRRRIVIVVDASPESKTALLWALSHAVQSTDCIILVNVIKPSSKRGDRSLKVKDPKSYELLHSMKSICKAKKPEVAAVVSLVEGTERGPAIVAGGEKARGLPSRNGACSCLRIVTREINEEYGDPELNCTIS